MRGVILAGGEGTRLSPLTEVTNKHLISIGRLPMIEYPLHTLRQIGTDGVNVVTGGEHFKDIAGYLGGRHKDTSFAFHYQREAGGIAEALSLVEYYVPTNLAVILGDNIFEENFQESAESFEKEEYGAMFFLKEVEDPERFGVAEVEGNRIVSIEEKPKNPKSNLAVTGLYFYDQNVFDKIKTIKRSDRGELEITDVNNIYIEEGKVGYRIVNSFWSDAGTHKSRAKCETYIRQTGLDQLICPNLD